MMAVRWERGVNEERLGERMGGGGGEIFFGRQDEKRPEEKKEKKSSRMFLASVLEVGDVCMYVFAARVCYGMGWNGMVGLV